jgi:hypothetical protein
LVVLIQPTRLGRKEPNNGFFRSDWAAIAVEGLSFEIFQQQLTMRPPAVISTGDRPKTLSQYWN